MERFYAVGRNLAKALPLDGGGLGGGVVSRRKSRDMKKHPVDGAHARARTLRQNMTEAERRVWQILRSHRMTGTSSAARYRSAATLPILCALLCVRGGLG
jgi:Protein of unknown function (DUF559)